MATDRVIVGRIWELSYPPAIMQLYYLTREQAEAQFVCGDGAGQLSGTVAGVSSSTTVSVGTRLRAATPASPQFTLTSLAAGPVDLVALNGTTAIVRHAMTYADGGTIPTLDFSNEAFTLQSNTLTVPAAAGSVFWTSEIITARGTRAQFQVRNGICCVADSLLGFPAARLTAGDLHHLSVGSVFDNSGPDVRLSEKFYAAAGDQSVTFGPAATPAAVTILRANGDLYRVDVPVQPEYAGQIELSVRGGVIINDGVQWYIYASSEYRGTSATWSLTVPDLAVSDLPQGPPNPRSVISSPKQARWGYELSSRDGDVYHSARVTSAIP